MKKIALHLFTFTTFLLIPLLANAVAPTQGQVGYWKLDEVSGNQAVDSSGNGITGNLMNNPVWSSGKVNGSLSFDGVSNYVNFGDNASIKNQAFTVSIWVKRNGVQNDWVKILNKGNGGVAPWATYKLEFNGSSDTTLNWHLGFTDGTSAAVQNSTPLADGVWTHIVGTFDGSVMNFYVNGVLESTNNVVSKTVMYDNVPLTIGGYAGYGYFKGNVDELRIYNRALSSSEVSALYTSDLPVNSNLEVYPGPGVNTYKSDLYNVEVYDGNNWLPAYVYKRSRVSTMHWHNGQTTSVNFLTLGTNGNVNVRVTKIGGSVTSAQVSPKSKNIPTQVTGGQAVITLKPNDKTWITINGDDANPLFIFADNLKPAVPSGAKYFGPGVTDISPATSNHYFASDNEVIYLDGGAWVKGNIVSKGKTNVQIMGPGVLSGELWDSQTIQNLGWNGGMQDYFMIKAADYGVVGDTTVKGITIVDSPVYNVVNVKSAYSVKVLSPWFAQTDGFNGVDIDNVFAFNGDTTFNNYMGYWNTANNSYTVNTKLTNSFGGTTNNAVILGGFYGNHPSSNFTSTVDNLDIKTYNDNSFVQYGAPHESSVFQVWVDNNDSSYGYKNQIYQNIRIEGNVNAPLMQLQNRVYPLSWGGGGPNPPLGNSYNISFKNITLEGQQLDGTIGKKSEIAGYDANNGFHNILLENVSIGGTVINQSNLSNYISVNPYVWGVNFSPAPTVTLSASPVTVSSGQNATLTWSTSNATTCTATGAWSGTKATSGSQSVTPSTTSVYTLTCTNNGGGTDTKSVTVSMSQNSPIAMWTLDSVSGTTALDSSGNNYNGSLVNYTGTSWVAGKVSNALNFDGVDDQVKISNATALTNLNTMTLSAWINPRSGGGNGTGGGRIISKNESLSQALYGIYIDPSDQSSISFISGYTPVVGGWKTPQKSISMNKWQNIAVTYDQSSPNNVPSIYVDGVKQTLTTLGTPSGVKVSDDGTLYLGSRGINNNRVYDGLIDQVRIYNRELTSSEILSNYNTETVGNVSDTVPPVVSIISPVNSSNVSGNVIVSANATDNVGVVGVQFKLDGANLSSEIIVSPYQANWNTSTVAVGNYTLSAIARDLAGNNVSSSVTVNVTTVLDPNLLGHWKLDSNSGTVATDSSANNSSGTLVNGPTWVAGKFGNALSFDGINDYVNLGNPTVLVPGSQLTLAGWVNVSDTNSTQVLVAKDNDGSNSTFLRVQSGGKVRCNIGGTNGGIDYGKVSVNTWTHLACTYDGTTARVYINGVQVGSFAKTGTIANNPNNWNIGARLNGAQLLMKGMIDDVRIYNKALSVSEIGTLMASPSVGSLPPTSNSQVQSKFISSDTVKTTATVNVRQTANGTKLGTQLTGVSGTVLGGPQVSGGYTWWNINFASGVDGWVAETYLSKTSPVAFMGTLQVGSVGEEVSLLQSTLKKLGYYTNGITGYFGELTKSAVAQFQTANSIEAVGVVGPKTRALLLENQ